MKKNILLFGANSFIAKSFIGEYSDRYEILPVYRQADTGKLNLDFSDASAIPGFVSSLNTKFDAVLFLQGLNPSQGATEISEEHFTKMLKVNLVTPSLLVAALNEKMNRNCLILFVSSVAKRKGSYDPSYAAAKSGMTGLMYSLAKSFPSFRFNMISLGLVEGSPVYNGMTEDFRARHAERMQNGSFIKAENVTRVIDLLIANQNLNTADIPIDGGYN